MIGQVFSRPIADTRYQRSFQPSSSMIGLRGLLLFFQQQVGLVEHQPARLLQQLGIVLFQFALDRAHLVGRTDAFDATFHRGDVDQVQQQTRALQMLEELRAQARALRRAFDQAGMSAMTKLRCGSTLTTPRFG
jgi:hypothetical protein